MNEPAVRPFRVLPAVTPENEHFWLGGAEGELRFLRCADCRYMKMNTLEKLHRCLDTLRPRVELPEDLRHRAEAPILRMLEWSR